MDTNFSQNGQTQIRAGCYGVSTGRQKEQRTPTKETSGMLC